MLLELETMDGSKRQMLVQHTTRLLNLVQVAGFDAHRHGSTAVECGRILSYIKRKTRGKQDEESI